MDGNWFLRTEMLFGKEGMEKLFSSKVIVFGIGGVGGFAVESLVRCGIGAIDIVDNDLVDETNLNRQIIATRQTIGQNKVDIMCERIKAINPDCVVKVWKQFYLPENGGEFNFSGYDYVVDAIDTVTGKIGLVLQAGESGTPIISSMGTGNKLNPADLLVADIYDTSVCPLARVMRRELKKRGVEELKVVYSKEKPMHPKTSETSNAPGSVSFVPSAAGIIIASEVVKDLLSDYLMEA